MPVGAAVVTDPDTRRTRCIEQPALLNQFVNSWRTKGLGKAGAPFGGRVEQPLILACARVTLPEATGSCGPNVAIGGDTDGRHGLIETQRRPRPAGRIGAEHAARRADQQRACAIKCGEGCHRRSLNRLPGCIRQGEKATWPTGNHLSRAVNRNRSRPARK